MEYFNVMSREWTARGYKHTMGFYDLNQADLTYPSWIGNNDFHSRHRAALLFKDPGYYGKFGWPETPKLDYSWQPLAA
jgi:hypothetical protein